MTSLKPWKRVSSRLLAECRIFNLKESETISPLTGDAHKFFFIETVDWVNVVPITDNDEVVCIRQFRHGSQAMTLEIPGGMVDPGEEPATSAVRECLEETGYEALSVESLGILQPNPAVFENRLHTYVARGVKPVASIQNTATEQTEVVLVPLAQLETMLIKGEIDHALVAATLWRLLYQLKS